MATIVCSHGFGVRADARGMFTDIAKAFPAHRFVMFDYNTVHENGDITVAPLDAQAKKLQAIINSQTDNVILLAHSQGCIVAGLIDLSRVEKVILLAPPAVASIQRVIDKLSKTPGSEINLEGISKLPRRDGTTTLIPKEYIESVNRVNPIGIYQKLANTKPVVIIRATQDEVLGATEFNEVNGVRLMDIVADHNFTSEARYKLIAQLANAL